MLGPGQKILGTGIGRVLTRRTDSPSRTVIERVLSINMKNEEFVVSAYNDFKWYDKRLAWNVYEFGNIAKININPGNVWTSGIIPYNAWDGTDNLHKRTKTKLSFTAMEWQIGIRN